MQEDAKRANNIEKKKSTFKYIVLFSKTEKNVKKKKIINFNKNSNFLYIYKYIRIDTWRECKLKYFPFSIVYCKRVQSVH